MRTTRATLLLLAALAVVPLACGDGDDGDERAVSDIGDAVIVTDQPGSGVTEEREGEAGESGAGLSTGEPSLDVLEEIDPALPSTLADERASCGAVDSVPTPDTLDEASRSIVCLLNAERASRSLTPLKLDARLSAGALAHARDMVRRRFFAHASPDGDRVEQRLAKVRYIRRNRGFFVGENLGFGAGAFASPNGIVQAWMESPSHRANILQPRFREVGIGAVAGAPRGASDGATTYTTTFGVLLAAKSSRRRR